MLSVFLLSAVMFFTIFCSRFYTKYILTQYFINIMAEDRIDSMPNYLEQMIYLSVVQAEFQRMNPLSGRLVAQALVWAAAWAKAQAVGFERLLKWSLQQKFAFARVDYSTFILSFDCLLVYLGAVLSVQTCVAQRLLLLARCMS